MKHPPHIPESHPNDPYWRLRHALAIAAIADRRRRPPRAPALAGSALAASGAARHVHPLRALMEGEHSPRHVLGKEPKFCR
jgi:hypothetical protein